VRVTIEDVVDEWFVSRICSEDGAVAGGRRSCGKSGLGVRPGGRRALRGKEQPLFGRGDSERGSARGVERRAAAPSRGRGSGQR
jgi:hypothetical protein